MNTINPNSQIVLSGLTLSRNPDKPVIDDASGVDGKLNQTSDGRGYCMATFSDPSNPFAVTRSRVLQQQMDNDGNPQWRTATPAQLKSWIGKQIPGEFVTRTVETYSVNGRDCNTYTAVVLKGESVETIFRSAGHELVNESAVTTADDLAVAEAAAEMAAAESAANDIF